MENNLPDDTEVTVMGHSRGYYNKIYSVEIDNEIGRRTGPHTDILIVIDAG